MILEVEIKAKIITISVKNRQHIVDALSWSEDHDLSRNLLPKINGILEKNSIKWEELKDVKLKSDLDENFTTYRIAKSLIEAIKFFIKNK